MEDGSIEELIRKSGQRSVKNQEERASLFILSAEPTIKVTHFIDGSSIHA